MLLILAGIFFYDADINQFALIPKHVNGLQKLCLHELEIAGHQIEFIFW